MTISLPKFHFNSFLQQKEAVNSSKKEQLWVLILTLISLAIYKTIPSTNKEIRSFIKKKKYWLTNSILPHFNSKKYHHKKETNFSLIYGFKTRRIYALKRKRIAKK